MSLILVQLIDILINSMLLRLLLSLVSESRLMYISLIVNIKSSLIHIHQFSRACNAVIACRNHFFLLNEQNNPSSAKLKVRQAANHYKSVLETARLAYANKAKESITYQKLGSHDFWQIVYSGLNEAKFAIPPLFNGPEEFFSAFDIKQSCLLKTFLRTLILMTQVYLYLLYLLKLI